MLGIGFPTCRLLLLRTMPSRVSCERCRIRCRGTSLRLRFRYVQRNNPVRRGRGDVCSASVLVRGENMQISDVDEADGLVNNTAELERNSGTQAYGERHPPRAGSHFAPEGRKSNKLIARELTICEGTVKLYVQRIMKKLGSKIGRKPR